MKTTEFLAVDVDNAGNMLAGGYTMDESVFDNLIYEAFNGTQATVPIIAHYPVESIGAYELYQIYIWPPQLTIG